MADIFYLGRVVGPASTYTTTTSYTDIGNLTFNVDAGAFYRFEAYIVFTNTASSVFQPTIGGTCTATNVVYRVAIENNSTTGASNSQAYAALSSPSGSPAGTAQAQTTACGAFVHGTIQVNAGGTLTVAAKHLTAASTIAANAAWFMLEQMP